MLRVTTLYAGSAAATAKYYTKYLTPAPGEEPGTWLGGQAAGLGLSGEVSTEALELLLSGRDPISGTVLGYPLVDRTLASGKVVRAVAGFDATVSAPKSLSVWWALTGDPGLAECHDVAVSAALRLCGAVRVVWRNVAIIGLAGIRMEVATVSTHPVVDPDPLQMRQRRRHRRVMGLRQTRSSSTPTAR